MVIAQLGLRPAREATARHHALREDPSTAEPRARAGDERLQRQTAPAVPPPASMVAGAQRRPVVRATGQPDTVHLRTAWRVRSTAGPPAASLGPANPRAHRQRTCGTGWHARGTAAVTAEPSTSSPRPRTRRCRTGHRRDVRHSVQPRTPGRIAARSVASQDSSGGSGARASAVTPAAPAAILPARALRGALRPSCAYRSPRLSGPSYVSAACSPPPAAPRPPAPWTRTCGGTCAP